MKTNALKIILITQRNITPIDEYFKFLSICIEHGVTSVQLREKQLIRSELFHFGKQLKSFLDHFNIPLIVNDDPALCLALNADGVHLGQSDLSAREARKMIGNHKIIGLSVNSLSDIEKANLLPIDYIGVGPIYPTKNKSDANYHFGETTLREAARISKLPIVAIGGITTVNANDMMNAGAYGIAAIGAFHDTSEPHIVTHQLKEMIMRHTNE